MEEGNMQEGNMQEGNMQEGNMQEGNMQEGNMQEGNMQGWRISEGHTQDRRSFVTQTVDRYARELSAEEAPILEDLVTFILSDVLESDALWAAHQKAEEWFNLPVVDHILTQCLKQVDLNSLDHLSQEELRIAALPDFIFIIRERWHCPVPFILC
jgi:hypothetical protein